MTRYFQLFIIGLGASLVFLDSSVNLAFPAIARNFQISNPEIIWVVIAFALPTISLMLFFGRIADRTGNRFVFQFGLALSLISFTVTSLAPDYNLFLFGRLLQGVAAAALIGAGMALARGLFGEKDRSRVIGYYVLMISFSSALGPFIGGLMLNWEGWKGVFSFRAAIAMIAFVLLFYVSSKERIRLSDRIHSLIVVIGFAGTTALLYYLSPHWLRLVIEISMIFLGIFGLVELFSLFRLSRKLFEKLNSAEFTIFVLTNIRSVFIHLAASSVIFILPFYLKDWRILDYRLAGLALALYPFGIAAAASQSKRLFANFQSRHIGNWGMCILLVGLWPINFWNADTAVVIICINLFIVGCGTGLFHISLNHYITGLYGPNYRGTAGALIEFTRTVGILSAALILIPVFTYLVATSDSTNEATQFFNALTLSFKIISTVPLTLLLLAGVRAYFLPD